MPPRKYLTEAAFKEWQDNHFFTLKKNVDTLKACVGKLASRQAYVFGVLAVLVPLVIAILMKVW